VVGNIGAVLAQPGLADERPDANGFHVPLPGLEAAFFVGTTHGRPAEQVADAWRQAQTAMRFCGLLGLGNVVDYDDLGSLAILAHLPQSAIESNPDVRAVAELTSTRRGRAVLDTLQQRLASGSIRETAAALYLHHSSVRYRLRKAEESLGLQLEDPRERLRAELALVLWRLSSN
jgi:sugar diacid utilization regulator